MGGDIVGIEWYKLTYNSGAQVKFKGTVSEDIILSIYNKTIPEYVEFLNGQIVNHFIFNAKNNLFIDVSECKVEKSYTEPNLEREVDRFASSYM